MKLKSGEWFVTTVQLGRVVLNSETLGMLVKIVFGVKCVVLSTFGGSRHFVKLVIYA